MVASGPYSYSSYRYLLCCRFDIENSNLSGMRICLIIIKALCWFLLECKSHAWRLSELLNSWLQKKNWPRFTLALTSLEDTLSWHVTTDELRPEYECSDADSWPPGVDCFPRGAPAHRHTLASGRICCDDHTFWRSLVWPPKFWPFEKQTCKKIFWKIW